jgi:hypothetical protein
METNNISEPDPKKARSEGDSAAIPVGAATLALQFAKEEPQQESESHSTTALAESSVLLNQYNSLLSKQASSAMQPCSTTIPNLSMAPVSCSWTSATLRAWCPSSLRYVAFCCSDLPVRNEREFMPPLKHKTATQTADRLRDLCVGRAQCWQHLDPVLISDANSLPTAVKLRCKHCSGMFSALNPSRTVTDHLKACRHYTGSLVPRVRLLHVALKPAPLSLKGSIKDDTWNTCFWTWRSPGRDFTACYMRECLSSTGHNDWATEHLMLIVTSSFTDGVA